MVTVVVHYAVHAVLVFRYSLFLKGVFANNIVYF